jgi:hypothetical protein
MPHKPSPYVGPYTEPTAYLVDFIEPFKTYAKSSRVHVKQYIYSFVCAQNFSREARVMRRLCRVPCNQAHSVSGEAWGRVGCVGRARAPLFSLSFRKREEEKNALPLRLAFGYPSPALEKDSAGNASPKGSGVEPLCSRKRLFYRLGAPSYGRPGGESRKALPVLPRSCKPRSVAHPIARGLAVQNRNWKEATMSTQTPDDLIVILNKYNADYTDFIGRRALLEAEGLIPAGTEWPEGYQSANWQAGGFHYWLRRERPEGAKGPRRAFESVDWFCLRRTPVHERSSAQISIALKEKALKEAIYRNSGKGHAEWDAHWNRYFKAMEDKPFQAFKTACGIVEKKRGRPRNSKTTQQGATA